MHVSMPVVATGGMTDDRWGSFYLKIKIFPKRARTLTRVKSVFKGRIAREGGTNMRNREKQREMRRLKHHEQSFARDHKPWQNASGCSDPTAYAALKNVTREEKKKHG